MATIFQHRPRFGPQRKQVLPSGGLQVQPELIPGGLQVQPAPVECPQCHMPTASGMGKAYCPLCGWNRGAAEKQTRLLLRLLPVLVMVFDAPLIVWIFVGHAEVTVLAALGALSIVPAILVVLVVKGKIDLPFSSTK